MQIVVNGVERIVPDRLTVAELLVELAAEAKHVAVEVNRELVPRSRHANRQLAEHDAVEVVTLVGGG